MSISLNKIATSLQTVLENPFGWQFVVHDQLPCLTLASGINTIGYVDGLEHIIGISRCILGLTMLAKQSASVKERAIAAAHIVRGGMEASGNWEMTMLFFDTIFTIGYIIVCVAKSGKKEPLQQLSAE